MASSSGGADAKEIILCINCRQQIQLRLHVKCCECPAMICAECFSYGCEAGQHLRGHNYEICDPLGGRTFDVKGSWGAIEERKLLAAAYRFKLGNWGEVTRLMETDRPISEVQEYYDRFFIRGPIGQFALKLLNWEESKRAMIAEGSLGYNCEADRITYLMMAMEAYQESKERLDPFDEDLTNKLDAIVQSHLFRLNLNDERPQCSEQSELSELIDLALSDDSCDPSDYDMDKKAPDDAYSTGLEPENDSDEDDENTHSASPSKSSKVETKSMRKSLRPSVVLMRPAKKKIRCGLRKSTLEKNGRASRYRRVQADSSSTDDDFVSEDEVEPMETDQTSVDDAHDSMHGLEKEDTTDDCTGSDSEEPKREPTKQTATPLNSAVRKRRRAKFVSKKARRLKEFQKRMARMTKAAERRLHELSELCPIETIRELRDSKPDLALYTNDYVGRPKVRQSDMDMLAYNAARGDFEWEWYNDAEQLISRLMIQESSDKVEDIENDIKFARIEKYYRILKTRKAYRRAIVEHDKISEFFRFMMNMTMEKRKASQILAQRPPLDKLLTRAQQCLTKKETEDLRSHVERADELMERIAKLQELQRNGVLSLKEAVFLVEVLCWTRFLMDSLPQLLFLNTIVELYFISVLSWTHLLKKVSRCYGRRNARWRGDLLSCSLESKIEEVMYIEEVIVDNPGGQLKSPLLSLNFHRPRSGIATPLRGFQQRRRPLVYTNGGGMEGIQQGSSVDMSSMAQSSGSYPVNVDAVLGANTVEDIADTHPDFARLLLDCYSAGCDLEEYKREFQRLKNLRIKRQGGVNQTLSFSLFPSVPSDLPGHLFVRLLKFHSLYEGACRKYLADVVNKRVEASPGFPYDLSTVGIQDLIQGGSSTEYYSAGSGSQSVIGSYADAHFVDPSDVAPGASSAVAYSPAVNSNYSQRLLAHGMRNDHLSIDQGMAGSMESATCMQRSTMNQVHGNMSQSMGTAQYVDRRVTATPLPSWSQQSNTPSEMRSRMATPLPPLEIRQCPVLQSGLSTPVPRAENRQMQAQNPHHRHMTTPISGMVSGQSYSGISASHSQHYQQMPNSSGMHGNVCADNRRMMTSTPMIGSVDSSAQASPFATPTKKPRARRKPVVVTQTQVQGQHSMTLQGRQLTATPIPGWQQHQTKSSMGMQGQPIHVQNRAMMSASVTPLQRQLTTPISEHREMMSATPLPGWAAQHAENSSGQVEGSSLVSSLPPLSQFTPIQQPQTRQIKTPYPVGQSRQLVNPVPHTQQRAMSTRPYEQSSHVYPQSREMMTPVPFAQTESVGVPYAQSQNIEAQMGTTGGEMYSQQAMPYQWSEGSSMDVYGQQGQFVQQSSYGQQSQFSQQMNSGSQQQVSFVAGQTVQYPTSAVHHQPEYPQSSVEVQKGSAFSQPYSYVQQAYPVPSGFQQQSSYSQDSNFNQNSYPQRSPYAQQQQQQQQLQTDQSQHQQQNQSLQQHHNQPIQLQQQHHQQRHLHQQQQQPIRRQVYENSAQFAGQYNQLIPTYSTQPACGIQNAQLTSAPMQAHQMPSSCDVAGSVLTGSEIAHEDQQSASNFATGMLDMSGSSSTAAIVELLQSNDQLASGETMDAVQSEYHGMVSTSLPGAPMIDPIIDGQLRTINITQCPPPPRNDSEATVPARTSPNSCSPGLMAGDDESSSLIPSFFYPKEFVQNDLSDLRIEDSPIEKGLNCQHFRFDIILAMKHHRIGKEDYERTLHELDQMEKEKCAGPLGDLLMKRLGLKRQEQYCHDGKFSVDELVAAFAANAKIQGPVAKMSERRMSSELFSEFLDDITPVKTSTAADQFHVKSHPDLHAISPAVPPSASKPSMLQSGDAMNDLGYLLSDDVIAEFDSMSTSTPAVVKPSSVGAPASFARSKPLSAGAPTSLPSSEPLSAGSSVIRKEVSLDKLKVSADVISSLTPSLKEGKANTGAPNRNDKSSTVFSSLPSHTSSMSFGQPAVSAHITIPPSEVAAQGKSTKEAVAKNQINSIFSPHSGERISSTVKVNAVFSGKIVPRKPLPEGDASSEKIPEIGAPAQPARRSDAVSNENYGNLSPFVISPEPLSDDDEWWRKDDETPPMLGGTPLKIRPDANDLKSSVLQKPEFSKPFSDLEAQSTSAMKVETSSSAIVFSTKHSPNRFEQKAHKKIVDRLSQSPTPSHSMHIKTSDEEEDEQSASKSKVAEHMKKLSRKTNKTLFGTDSSSEDSAKEDAGLAPSTSRAHQSASLPSLPLVSRKKSHSPHGPHSPRSGKKKSRKSSLPSRPSKESKEVAQKSGLSKVELSREVLAKQIAEIIEDERSKLPPEEAKLHKRPLSPASLDVVIQDLMQHHISEDTSPSRELFASKLLGTDIFSKLFFRAGKCVFRHYEEMDDFRSKEKGRGRRKGTASRKRDTELLRGIRKSREIQKFKDALRAAKEPSEAEKKAAAERAKLEAMPWLARATFKPAVQQGTLSRFVIPKKSSGNRSGGESSTSRTIGDTKHHETARQDEAEVKSSHHKLDEGITETSKSVSFNEKSSLARRSRSPPSSIVGSKIMPKVYHEERMAKVDSPVARKSEEVYASFSFYWMPKSSTYKARAKHTWPLKRWRSASAFIEEPVETWLDSTLVEHPEDNTRLHSVVGSVDTAADSFKRICVEKSPVYTESSNTFQASFVSARESELAVLALQQEMSRSEQGSPDDQYDALRYLASMPESEFGRSDSYEPSAFIQVAKQSLASGDASKAPEIPSKLFSSDQVRSEMTSFEQANRVRMDSGSQQFYGTEFDSDPWRLPSATAESLVSRHPSEITQTAGGMAGGNSLYSSLQEELDTILRDTLGDTLYSPTAIGGAPSHTVKPVAEKFEWPKANVPVRSYALDVILPPLMCDKSRIAILDMCRCQRCTTRSEYFCDHEEWKYLYDCAISCRKEREEAEQRRLSPPDQVCSKTFMLSRESEKKRAKCTSKVLQHTSDRDRLSLFSKFFMYTKYPSVESVEGRRWIFQRTFASEEFSVSTAREQYELRRPPQLENTVILREELRISRDCDYLSTFVSPSDVALCCENEDRALVQTIVPIYQVSNEKTAMSVLSAPVVINLQKGGSSRESRITVPIPRTEIFGTEVADLAVSYTQVNDALAARATINVPRRTSALLSIHSLDVTLCAPQWIVEKSIVSCEISHPQPRHDATLMNCSLFNIDRKRGDSSLSSSVVLPVPRIKKSSFISNQVHQQFLASESTMDAEVSLPLPVTDATFYKSCQVRVRRKRAGASASTDIVLPIPRLDTCFMSICEWTVDEKREGCQAITEYSSPLPREESAILNITGANFHHHRQNFTEDVIGLMLIPRMEYTTTNILKIAVKRKRSGFAASSDAVVTIPRKELAVLSVTEGDLAHSREASRECFEKVIPIPRVESAILKSLTLRVKRSKKPSMDSCDYTHPIAREEDADFTVGEWPVGLQRTDDVSDVCYAYPIPNVSETVCSITARSFDILNCEVYVFDSNRTMTVRAEEDVAELNIRHLRGDQLRLVEKMENNFEMDQNASLTQSRKDSFENEPTPDDAGKSSSAVVPIYRENVEIRRLSTIRMSRKRKHEEDATQLVKRMKIDREGLSVTEESFSSDANRMTEVVYIKDPRLPLQCSNSFVEVSKKWRSFAHQHMPHLVFSSYLVTQFATLLQRVFDEGVNRCTITMKDLTRLFSNVDGIYDLSIFTNPEKVIASFSDQSGPIWDRLMRLRMQRNSTELLNRKTLAPLYLFLGPTNLPRVGKPWRKWLKPIDATTESRIGCQLALCMRIPDLVGVDDMDPKLQAIKMWWIFMMIRGTLPWYIYPCLSRRQLFLLVRLLEALENVGRPPFCLYPPDGFFKGVKKVLRHPRTNLIPKDIYHPDITTMATLLKMKRNRPFHVDRSLPELLSHWMDDINKIDAYLAADVKVKAMDPSSFLTQGEWAWRSFNRGCVPDHIKYDRKVSVEKTEEKLKECLANFDLPLEQRRQISVLRTALVAWSKFDNGPPIEHIPIDIINPFALSASFIALLPMPEGFVGDCFAFLEKVSKKSSQPCQNPVRKNTKSLQNWKWKPSERLASVGKPTSAGTKANGKTTISTLFEEFWRSPKDFSTISVSNEEASMTSHSPNFKNTIVSVNEPADQLTTKSHTRKHEQNIPGSSVHQLEPIEHNDGTDQFHLKIEKASTKKAITDSNEGPSSSHAPPTHLQANASSSNIEKYSKPMRRWRKRKDFVVDEAKSTSGVMRPLKRSKIEIRKRRRAKTSDEDGPPSAKQPMSKIPEHRFSKLRHTLARRGMETEKMVHETVLRAAAIVAVQGSDAPIPRKSVKRRACEYSSSDDSEVVQPARRTRVKRTRRVTIFDVTNFEWVLGMSLRRPRAFVGLYQTMKCQYRMLEKRRWVEENRKLYDRAQFEKFLKETSHSEVEMIEKAKLLKAEKDMELALGVTRAEAERMGKFAVKDLAHWYGMSARYAVQADILAQKALEEAKIVDEALALLTTQETEAEKERVGASQELSIQNSVSVTLNSIVQTIETKDYHESGQERVQVKNTLADVVSHTEQGGEDDMRELGTVELFSSMTSECGAHADDIVVKEQRMSCEANQNNMLGAIARMDDVDEEKNKVNF
ncbi:SANT domain-containing protein [Trichostrongylus colubriformis]|uniref:SANT domain-containing protein n=1 Tax=Trichostrongylus colubriformis TaxID=6319 RepID=A0AAN8ILE0_TRICO